MKLSLRTNFFDTKIVKSWIFDTTPPYPHNISVPGGSTKIAMQKKAYLKLELEGFYKDGSLQNQ